MSPVASLLLERPFNQSMNLPVKKITTILKTQVLLKPKLKMMILKVARLLSLKKTLLSHNHTLNTNNLDHKITITTLMEDHQDLQTPGQTWYHCHKVMAPLTLPSLLVSLNQQLSLLPPTLLPSQLPLRSPSPCPPLHLKLVHCPMPTFRLPLGILGSKMITIPMVVLTTCIMEIIIQNIISTEPKLS